MIEADCQTMVIIFTVLAGFVLMLDCNESKKKTKIHFLNRIGKK